jgi:hypothetical protein
LGDHTALKCEELKHMEYWSLPILKLGIVLEAASRWISNPFFVIVAGAYLRFGAAKHDML